MNPASQRLPEDQAIRDRAEKDFDTTFLVEAAAGTGKTTLLVSRILNIVLAGRATLREIAAITFTEKAAGDLKVRLRQAIEERLREQGGFAAPKLRQALSDLEGMPVNTIHAFCADLIRERPVEAGVEPNFGVADELTSGLLLEETWEDWLAEALSSDDQRLRAALEAGIRPGPEQGSGVTMFSLARELIEHRDSLAEEPMAPPWDAQRFAEAAAAIRATVESATALCSEGCKKPNDDKLMGGFLSLRAWSERAPQGDVSQYDTWFSSAPNPKSNVGRKDDWVSEGALAEARDACSAIKKRIAGATSQSSHRILHGLVAAVRPFVMRYEQAKREQRLLDFDDLLIVARDMLLRSREARDYFKRNFEFLLVDEFQDTNPLQTEIAFLLCERPEDFAAHWDEARLFPGKLFLVGDPKQSIYRFRRADLDLYGRVKEIVERQGEMLQLAVNFRTVPAVIRELNPLFEPMMQGPVNGRFEPEHVELKPFRVDERPGPRLWLVPPPSDVEVGKVDLWRRQESGGIAATIRKLVEMREPVRADGKPLKYSDIAVLYRTGTGLDALEEALRAHEVPYQVAGGKHYYSRLEFQDLLSVLVAVDNPYNGPAVVGALRSPFFGCSDADLAAHVARGGSFNYLDESNTAADAVAAAFDVLRGLHDQRRADPPDAVIASLFRCTQALQIYAMKPHGEQRVANLLKVADMARGLGEAGVSSFSAVVRHLSAMEEISQGEGESPVAEAEEDFVRLITLHKSKGLEFPVVVLAFLGHGMRRTDAVFLDAEFRQLQIKGAGLQSSGFEEAAEAEKERAEYEERRLFYVGATRARDLLILPAYWTNPPKDEESAEPYMLAYLGHRFPRSTPETWGDRFMDASGLDIQRRATDALRFRPTPWEKLPPEALAYRAHRNDWSAKLAARVADLNASRGLATPSALHRQPEEGEPLPASRETSRGALFGELVHRLFEVVDFASPQDLRPAVAIAAEELNLDAEMADDAVNKVMAALKLDLFAERAAHAKAIHREVPFTVPTDTGLMEGRIDLLLIEPDGAVIVDYKTDRLADEAAMLSRADFHRPQMEAYARALARLGVHVKETVLVFLSLGQTVSIKPLAPSKKA
jgi:ATP-dependent exoDNAse (exonuclease V) beta subunit